MAIKIKPVMKNKCHCCGYDVEGQHRSYNSTRTLSPTIHTVCFYLIRLLAIRFPTNDENVEVVTA